MFYSVVAHARVITPAEAMQEAGQFLTHNSAKRVRAQSNTALTLAHAAIDKTGAADYYVFNRADDAGYVIVAADDNLTPVIGYVDSGAFSMDALPADMLWWLDECQQQIEYLKQHPDQARKASPSGNRVDPLLTTCWGQSAPYNAKCPTYVLNYTAYRSATGCVATAMAQIMNYHQWPLQGTGQHSYSYKATNSSAEKHIDVDFSLSSYDWSHMDDFYDGANDSVAEGAVAQLMFDAGAAVSMNYGAASGALTNDVVHALFTHFGYSRTARLCAREDYSVEEWEQIIRNELDNHRPVLYSGMKQNDGHAWVCDGYDGDGYFHFNWGWNGRANGYFLLSMLNPNTQGNNAVNNGYNSMHEIVAGITPDHGDPVPDVDEPSLSGTCSLTTATKSAPLGSTVLFTATNVCMTGNTTWNTLYWGIAATSPDLVTDDVIVSPNSYFDASGIRLSGGHTLSGIKFTPPTTLDDGLYYLRMIYLVDLDEMGLFKGQSPSSYVVDMKVENGVAYFSKHCEDTYLMLNNLQLSGTTLYRNQTYSLQADAYNGSSEDFCDEVRITFVQNGVVKSTGDALLLSIPGHGTRVLKTNFKVTAAVGSYTLTVVDVAGNKLASVPVKVADGGGTVNMSIVSNVEPASSEMSASEVRASAVIKNSGGAFSGPLDLLVLDANNNILNQITTDVISVLKNETVTVNFEGGFHGRVGGTYYLCLRNPNPAYASRYQLWSTAVPFTVCEEIPKPSFQGDVNGDGDVDVADINAILAVLTNLESASRYRAHADVNGDGDIDIADINFIVAMGIMK